MAVLVSNGLFCACTAYCARHTTSMHFNRHRLLREERRYQSDARIHDVLCNDATYSNIDPWIRTRTDLAACFASPPMHMLDIASRSIDRSGRTSINVCRILDMHVREYNIQELLLLCGQSRTAAVRLASPAAPYSKIGRTAMQTTKLSPRRALRLRTNETHGGEYGAPAFSRKRHTHTPTHAHTHTHTHTHSLSFSRTAPLPWTRLLESLRPISSHWDGALPLGLCRGFPLLRPPHVLQL